MVHQRTPVRNQPQATYLQILNITRREAVIEGKTVIDDVIQDYVVNFDKLSCTCDAGRFGNPCVHVRAALTERARMHGYGFVAFHTDEVAAHRACDRLTYAGCTARVMAECGYIWTESGDVPARTALYIDDLSESGVYVLPDGSRYSTYLAADEARQTVGNAMQDQEAA